MELTRYQQKRLDAAEAIALDRPTPEETAWLARQLVQATLPHSDPKDVPAWTRQNGNLTLTIQPAYEKGKSIGLPYGTIPRLLLFWVTTEALKKQSRKLKLGSSLADFMHQLDILPTGGRWGSIPRVRDQMKRLFAARISFDYSDNQSTKWMNMDIAPRGELWWDYKNPENGSLFESWIELGEQFYEAVLAAPVPVDMRALKALRKSPLALDLYAWATYTTYQANKSSKPRSVSWELLRKQFGADYGDTKNFKRKCLSAFEEIKKYYPDLAHEQVRGGIAIHPSTNAVLPRPASDKNTRNKRVFPKSPPTQEAAALFPANDIIVSAKTLERARILVQEAGTGWDFNHLEQAFYAHARKRGESLRSPSGAFIGFVKRKIQKQPR